MMSPPDFSPPKNTWKSDPPSRETLMLVEAYYRNPLAATPQPLSGHEISGYRRANPSGSKRDNAQENERLI